MQIFKFQRRSCKLSILFPPRRKSAPEILLAGYTVLLIYNGRFVVSTYRSFIRPIDGDLRSRPFWIINNGNIDWGFLFVYYIVCGHWDQITSISTKKKGRTRQQRHFPFTQTTRVEILCIKRGIILQTRKSLITEVRGRTGGCSSFTQTTRVEILCIKRGIILQTRKSLITKVRGRTGGCALFTQTTRVEILCIKRGIILQTRKSLITKVRGRTGGCALFTQTTRVEILCIKRGIILQTLKSLITEVRGRTGGCSTFTQTTRVEILCIKRGIMLQTHKSLITEVRGRTGGAHHLHKPPGWKSCA